MLSSARAFEDLINKNLEDVIPILKSLANESRIKILSLLLEGPRSFQYLLAQINLQKTALANHLAQLIEVNLITKPNYGQYQISSDAKEFLRAIWSVWTKSIAYELKNLGETQSKKMSSEFLHSFFRKP